MGACDFRVVVRAKTAKAAFTTAVEEARYESGHSGYTGTIAEKSSFTLIAVPEGMDPRDFADKLMCDSDPRIDDKWGPAGCVALGAGEWLFFGYASS